MKIKKSVAFSSNVSWSGLIEIGAAFTLAFSLLSLFDPGILLLELASHFRVQYAVAALLFAAILIYLKRVKFAMVMAMTFILNSAFIVPWYVSKPTIDSPSDMSDDAASITFLLSNVNSANTQYQRLIQLIKQHNPGIVILLEVNQDWIDALGAIEQDYPFKLTQPRHDNFGIALYSRVPQTTANVISAGKADLPSILARFNLGQKTIHLVATHPLPPIGSEYFDLRNDQLDAVASFIGQLDTPFILIGDLNVSMFSNNYRQTLKTANLVDARQGFGLLPTWPTFFPPAMIAIDHCLISPALTVKDISTGPNIGSDHLPLLVNLNESS